MNRNGHCASSETLRRIDMGMEESLTITCGDYVPNGIIKQQGLCTGTAWDNFDINVETLNGLGTTHHTYGIACQNIPESEPAGRERNITASRNIAASSGNRSFNKVALRASSEEIEPYYKKPKISHHDFSTIQFLPPDTLSRYTTRNLLWSIAKSLFPNDVPNWSGWNSLYEVDINPKQLCVT